ncbi:hypothetical protein ACIO13_18305 [Streptomyces sp. NPDC087425]|uniref:hypothetical protein n=1 Tax=Streptomyces sp. NPDC087425 TaxID=3365787 RepID=UPI003803F028
MTRLPTAAQRRVIDAADPVTGRLKGTAAQHAALVRLGLAFRHPRPPHAHFLTPAGHRIREATGAGRSEGSRASGVAGAPGGSNSVAVSADSETSGTAGASAGGGGANSGDGSGAGFGGVFVARVGGEGEVAGDGSRRAREVRGAWEGLLELRRMTHPDGAMDRPCGWERAHLVRAAALALEAGGHCPAGTGAGTPGYRVRATPQPEAVAVHEPDAAALRACAATLERAGWQVGEYTEPRTRARYLLASPRRV